MEETIKDVISSKGKFASFLLKRNTVTMKENYRRASIQNNSINKGNLGGRESLLSFQRGLTGNVSNSFVHNRALVSSFIKYY